MARNSTQARNSAQAWLVKQGTQAMQARYTGKTREGKASEGKARHKGKGR
jgi:hypothetical protein